MVKVRKSIVGEKFNRLTVISQVDDYVSPAGTHYANWLCECECGNQIQVTTSRLKTGTTKSCGCFKTEQQSKTRDNNMIGKKFGRLMVESYAGSREKPCGAKEATWNCICECGNKKIVTTSSLKSGNVKSCGCYKTERISELKRKVLCGQSFGLLTVLDAEPEIQGHCYWKCKCACGNVVRVTTTNLLSGHVKSCGCLTKAKDITGERFGQLTVLSRDSNYYTPSGTPIIKWKCRCDCGQTVSVAAPHLKSGHVMSCGCMHKSIGEQKIEECLKQMKICYETQKTFENCKNHICLRYDFYIEDKNMCIEYDGIQHFQPIDFAGRGKKWAEKELSRTQENDKIKNEYCEKNNILLLRIPYTEFENIDEILSKNLS